MSFVASSALAALLTVMNTVGVAAQRIDQTCYQPHYLVGLLNYPNDDIPEILQGHTSGTAVDASLGAPWDYIPSVGFSDIEPYLDAEGNAVLGEFLCLSDNGYGSSSNSADYALNIVHMKIQKPFTFLHGESTFEKYTPTENLNTILIHDPNELIKWENGADIQVTYGTPDDTWADYAELRVLTGRDFDVEGMAVISQDLAIVGDELMPAIFAINTTSGVVLTPFVRTPDIDENGDFNGKFLSTRGDKVHCSIESLEANECPEVASEVVDNSEYRKHDPSGGYEGFSVLADGTIAAFLEKTTGDTTLGDEPGVRVYHVTPGDGTSENPPKFEKFLGFYPLELNAENIADVSAIPGSSTKVAVIERNGFPGGHMWPAPVQPANKLCVVDLYDLDEDMVMTNKKCILNYHDIDDPWDVDDNGIFKYAQTQVTNEQLIVVDDYCMIAGTDTNFPTTNQFGLEESQVPFWQEVTDTRFMVICFLDPVFNLEYGLFDSPTCTCSAPDAEADADANDSTSPPVDLPEVPEDGGDCQTISELVCSTDDFSILCQLIQTSGLDATLDSGTWTVFAPSNAAFEGLDSEGIPVGKVEDLLLFHVVPDVALASSDLVCKGTITMASGKDSRTKCDDNNAPSVYYQTGADNNDVGGDPEIVATDIEVCNGSIVHVLNGIMLPSGYYPDISPNSGN